MTEAEYKAFLERQEQWFDFYPWLPRQITDGPDAGRMACFETIQRKDWQGGFCYESWYTSYRTKPA